MLKEDYEFGERINRDLEARRTARKILGVKERSNNKDLKRAYRRMAKKYHPDKNPGDQSANKKFILVKCAYELLAKDEPCPALLEQIRSWSSVPDDDKYVLDNPWGHFLWWREKFFGWI